MPKISNLIPTFHPDVQAVAKWLETIKALDRFDFVEYLELCDDSALFVIAWDFMKPSGRDAALKYYHSNNDTSLSGDDLLNLEKCGFLVKDKVTGELIMPTLIQEFLEPRYQLLFGEI